MAMSMLEFAIRMELDGKKYYEDQAARHSLDGLKVVFDILAGEEGGHAQLLQNMRDGSEFLLGETGRQGLRNVFESMADFRIDTKILPDQEEAYRLALEKERQSIELYRSLLAEDGDKALFEYLIKQEEEHYGILEEIVKLVNRPRAWVESAEFGLREEY